MKMTTEATFESMTAAELISFLQQVPGSSTITLLDDRDVHLGLNITFRAEYEITPPKKKPQPIPVYRNSLASQRDGAGR